MNVLMRTNAIPKQCRWAVTGLSAVGLALSTFLAWHYVVGGSVIGCGGGSPCDQVLSGRWSSIGGVVPVSGLAAGAYLAMLVASFFIGPATEASVRRLAWGALLVLVGAAAGSAVWFTIVQKWIIGAFCPYCMATHVNSLLLAALVIWQTPKQIREPSIRDAPTSPAPTPASDQRVSQMLPSRSVALIGLVVASLMVGGQIALPPAAIYRGGESQENLPVIDPRAVPLVGSPYARHVVNLLFDYNCLHCQRLHLMLEETIRRYDGKLAFALCPAPLNSQCNPYVASDTSSVKRDRDPFKDSCELARIALTIWVAKREAFAAFDHWMFTPEPGHLWRPRTLEAARAKAIELIGQAKFDSARGDPWIERHLQTSVRLYGDTGANAVPKLVYRSRWIVPQPKDVDDLVAMLREQLTLPPP